jgi:hypothetical protein
MTKRSLLLIAVAIVLGTIYVVAFSDLFSKPKIEIIAQIRPTRNVRTAPGDVPVDPVSFAFDKKYSLTSIRVVSAEEEKTNKYPHELWSLITDSNSMPTKVLVYGQPPRGMKPKVPRAKAEALEPDVIYHIYLQAGKATGEKKFATRESVMPQ